MKERIDPFKFADELGPEKILHIYDPKTRLKAIVVVDNTARGPSMGGIRMAPDVSTKEVARLARAMTLKNAAADLPHGGGKAGIIANHRNENKEELIRSFAKAIELLEDYIPGPDMGTNEEDMAIIHEEIDRAIGLPERMGGIPLDELGTTGLGVTYSTLTACDYLPVVMSNCTAAIEGFGSVGRATMHFMSKQKAKIVAVSDSKGCIYNPEGLDCEELLKVKEKTGAVKNYKPGKVIKNRGLFGLQVDILIPGARPNVITENNVRSIKAKLVIEAANIPITRKAEEILHKTGILVIPDFIANAGGVIAGACEYARKTKEEAFDQIKSTIVKNTKIVLEAMRNEGIFPRDAAERLARECVLKAM